MKKKTALITGITGQDGSYLAEFLLSKGYKVVGLNRRTSSFNTSRINHILKYPPHIKNNNIYLTYGDMNDALSLMRIVKEVNPDEIYNLAAQSHVAVSFDEPEYTANTIALGTLRLLEIIRLSKKKIKFYNASTSEIYGNTSEVPQNEKTRFEPCSPYAIAKLYSHWITVNYRKSYNMFACNGILFNHESPRRGDTFVTKKIIKSLIDIKYKKIKKMYMGNLYSKRDWGHAKDYVEMQWKMLQQRTPDDYVISSGKNYSVKDFINISSRKLGLKLIWKGKGLNEKGYINGKATIFIKKNYLRPSDVNNLLGDYKKAKQKLNWKPKINLDELINDMIKYEEQKLKSK